MTSGSTWLTLRSFYSRPLSWLGVLVTSAALTYVGGGVMFWFHAIFRGEQGPAIGDVQHYLLDATLGFVALTPLVGLIVPATVPLVRRRGVAGRQVSTAGFVVVIGLVFGVATGPGPLLHNQIVGGGTWLGDHAEAAFGHDSSVAARNADAPHRSALTEGALQVAVGVPVYILSALAAVTGVRALARRQADRAGGTGVEAARPPGPAEPLRPVEPVPAEPGPHEGTAKWTPSSTGTK